jgi:hypothetical protein
LTPFDFSYIRTRNRPFPFDSIPLPTLKIPHRAGTHDSNMEENVTYRTLIRVCLAGSALLLLLLIPNVSMAATQGETSLSQPETVLFLDTGGTAEHVVVVEKSTQSLFLFRYDGKFKQIFKVPCSTGEEPGRKAKSGDKKTPEGVYFFTKEHPDRDLAPIYGSRAFPIDYPNLMDRIANRDGNSIWLHGTNKPLEPMDSNGCIVLENRDIDRLAPYITLNRTPMIIVETLSGGPVVSDDADRESIGRLLSDWAAATATGSYHTYLNAYGAEYLPDISWWPEWRRVRNPGQAGRPALSITLKRTSIFRLNGIYTVLAERYLKAGTKETYAGTVKLFLKKGASGFRIVGEEHQVLPAKLRLKSGENPLVALARQLKPPVGEEIEIARLVDAWLEAWSAKDIDRYGAYYASDFKSQGGANLKAWLAYKDQLNRQYRFIRVTRKNMVVKKDKGRRTVSFVQTYASNRFKAVGIKQLVLKREGDQWKIYREIWKKR